MHVRMKATFVPHTENLSVLANTLDGCPRIAVSSADTAEKENARTRNLTARTTILAIKTFALIQGSKVLLWQIVKSSADFAKVMTARITRVDVQLGPTKTIARKVVMSLG